MKRILTLITMLGLTLSAMAQVPTVTLSNGAVMPQFGIGTFNQTNEQAYAGVLYALKLGYRHIDTAHAYGDEEGVGRAIKDSGIPREEIWVTSKLWPTDYADGNVLQHIDEMLERLQLDYLDLLYIHQPFGDLDACWAEMEKAVEMGKVRTLGISNFDRDPALIDRFATEKKIKPAILQLESHPYRQALDIKAQCEKYGILLEDWFPLGGEMSQGTLFRDPVIAGIAQSHGKTPAQVLLRWHLQDGRSTVPGSKTPAHIEENFNIFDFVLTDAEMAAIRNINKEEPFFRMPGNEVRRMSTEGDRVTGEDARRAAQARPAPQFPERTYTAEEQKMVDLSSAKWQWMSDKNVAELEKLFDKNAKFVHMGGYWGTPEELQTIGEGGIWYKKADVHDVDLKFIDKRTCVVYSTIHLTAVLGGQNEVVNPFVVSEFYVKSGKSWKLASLVFTRTMGE